jgi:hypothetical protein
MSSKRLTDIGSSTGLTLFDLIHIVNTGDTSQGNPAGSSYKATLKQVADTFSGIFSTGFTGGTVNGLTNFTGGLSANTFNTTSFTLNGVTITGFTFGSTFTGNTSASCITDIYVSNVNSCSPLHIQPNSNGNVLIGENGGVNVGIGTSLPSEKLEVSGKTKTTTLQVTYGSPQLGYVLTAADTKGNMTWQLPTGDGVIYTGEPIEGLNGVVITANTSLSTGLNDLMNYLNKRYCDLEATFTSYPDQRYTVYGLGYNVLAPNHKNYCCTELPPPFDEYPDPTPCDNRWYNYAKPINPSVEVSISGGEAPYTYEWSIAEGDEAGHRFRYCYDSITQDKVYLDVNFKKIVDTLLPGGNPTLAGPYYPKTTIKQNEATIAGTTLQLKVTDANGANKTFYYRYTSEDCYPVNASVCNSYNVEFCNQGQTFFKNVTIELDFMDDERRIPTCTDLSSYGINRPELNEADIDGILREQRNAFLVRQNSFFLASSAGNQFQPFDKPTAGFLPRANLNLNTLTYPYSLYANNNGKAPLKYINVFDGGYPISQVYDEVAGVLTNLWTEVVDPDYGTTLADRYPGVTDLIRRPTVKTFADLPTPSSNDPIPIVNGQIVRVFDGAQDFIWNAGTSSWETFSLYLEDVLSVRRTRGADQRKASEEMQLAMKSFTWANVYVLQHMIKTFRDYQITNI